MTRFLCLLLLVGCSSGQQIPLDPHVPREQFILTHHCWRWGHKAGASYVNDYGKLLTERAADFYACSGVDDSIVVYEKEVAREPAR